MGPRASVIGGEALSLDVACCVQVQGRFHDILIICTTANITVKMNNFRVKRKEQARCSMRVNLLQRICDEHSVT